MNAFDRPLVEDFSGNKEPRQRYFPCLICFPLGELEKSIRAQDLRGEPGVRETPRNTCLRFLEVKISQLLSNFADEMLDDFQDTEPISMVKQQEQEERRLELNRSCARTQMFREFRSGDEELVAIGENLALRICLEVHGLIRRLTFMFQLLKGERKKRNLKIEV